MSETDSAHLKFRTYPHYKPSSVEWLGEIPEHWEVRKLKQIALVQFSNVDKNTVEGELPVRLCNYVDVYNNDFISSNIEFMNATATPVEIAKFTVKYGDVIITKDSESWTDIAVPAYVTDQLEGVLCGYHLAQIRAHKKILDGKYLFRSFVSKAINYQFQVESTGITRYGLGNYWLENGLFVLPPLPEQCAIAAFLDRETAWIDALIAKKRRQIELLQEKRSALISHAVTKGLNPDAPMKDSGSEWLGEIPEHWGVYRAKVLFQEVKERSETGEEELLTVSHITGVSRRSDKDVTMFMAESLEGYKQCSPGDLVINTMWAWMGAIGVAWEKGIVSPSYNVYRFRKPGSEPHYFDLLFRTRCFISEVICQSQGVWTSRLRLYPEAFFEIRIPYPPPKEQEIIVAAIDKQTGHFNLLTSQIEKSINTLCEYRSALISAAVTGKIDVRDNKS